MRIGFTASTFDLLHAGHIQMLHDAKEQCDKLIVGLQIDPSKVRSGKNSPIQTVIERYIQLKGVKYVDEIIPYETEKDLEDLLTLRKIHVRIIGEEYKNKWFTGKDICEELGIEMYYNNRFHRFSSSELRNRIQKV